MGLFSFLFQKNKIIRSTHEAETLREVYREDNEIFTRVELSEDLRRLQELEEYVDSPEFKVRRKEIEQLSYRGSKFYLLEKRYKALLKAEKLRAYYLIKDSRELKGYLQVKGMEYYRTYMKLKVVINATGFDRKLQAIEYEGYLELLRNPKIAALIKFEKNRKFKYYSEIKNTPLPKEFEELTAVIKSEEFKKDRAFLLDKKRYLTTDDYKLLNEYELLKKQPDIMKYYALHNDVYFNNMRRWDVVFYDDFNTGKLDENRWITKYYAGERFLNDTYGVGKDVQLFTNDNISLTDNSVCLNFRKESIIGKYWDDKFGIKERKYEYTSGILSTATSFRQRYGRFEAKIKLTHSPVNQCFWMLGDMEIPHIDIMKSKNTGICMGNIFPCHGKCNNTLQLLKELELANEYYIFTLEWTSEKLVWMVNDVVVKEVRDNIPDIPMYIAFSLGTSEIPADKHVPGKMEIDWVRVYKMKNEFH